MTNSLAIFEGYKIRRHYDENSETWYFSVIDILQVLIQQPDFQAARNYWKVLKNRLNQEGSETVTKCNRLKMVAEDGKMRLTDVADPETILRLIQSVPSPKAEPIKLWLAKVGYERMQDMADPARSVDRAREFWQQHGRSEKWIQQRMMGQETRNKRYTPSLLVQRRGIPKKGHPRTVVPSAAGLPGAACSAGGSTNSPFRLRHVDPLIRLNPLPGCIARGLKNK